MKHFIASLWVSAALALTPSAAQSRTPAAAPSAPSAAPAHTPRTNTGVCTSNRIIANASNRVFILVQGPETGLNRLTYCERGVEKLSARTSTGRPQHDGGVYTPEGNWTAGVLQRDRVSGKYKSPMPYSIHVQQGIFIHQGNTRRPFASHGCIRLDGENARSLFQMVWAQKRQGNQVDIIIRGTDPRR